MRIAKVAVVGAGNMGSGIAQKIATEGFPVTLIDSTQELADKGKQRIEKLLIEGMDRGIFKPEQVDTILSRVEPTGSMEAAADVDLVIEAIFEDRQVKQDLFSKLSKVCKPGTALATNTSSFLVSDLATAADRPERVCGLHYFYHPAKNRLVEVIGHSGTDPKLIDALWQFQEQVGKTPIASADAPGFVVNRFFVPWLNEAVRLHEEGFSIATIEEVAKSTFGIGMGPFQLMNVTGVPITLHAATALAEKLGDFYAPAASIGLQVANQTPWDLEGDVDLGAAEAVSDRLWGVVFHVALELLSEGVGTIDDVDIGARVGLRWPAGPFETINSVGLEKAAAMARGVEEKYGLSEPTALVAQLEAGKPFPLQRVKLDVSGDIATVTINRPDKLNALDPETVRQLEERFDEAESNAAVKAIVIAGAGKTFVAGADVAFFVDKIRADEVDDIVKFAAHGQELFRRIEKCPKRVICKLDGTALGGGAELALACHVIVASPRAFMAFPETGIGIYPGLGGTQRLARRLGKGVARYMLYTGKGLKAEQLAKSRVAWKMVAVDAMDEAIAEAIREAPVQERGTDEGLKEDMQMLGKFLGSVSVMELLDGSLTLPGGADMHGVARLIRLKAPLAIRAVEKLTLIAEKDDVDAGLQAETDGLHAIFSSKDALEGMRALLERRKPSFVGE